MKVVLEIEFTYVKVVIFVGTKGAYDKNYVNVVQARNSHLSNTPGPGNNLSEHWHLFCSRWSGPSRPAHEIWPKNQPRSDIPKMQTIPENTAMTKPHRHERDLPHVHTKTTSQMIPLSWKDTHCPSKKKSLHQLMQHHPTQTKRCASQLQ